MSEFNVQLSIFDAVVVVAGKFICVTFSQQNLNISYFSANYIEGIGSKQTYHQIECAYTGSNGFLDTVNTLEGLVPVECSQPLYLAHAKENASEARAKHAGVGLLGVCERSE